MRQTPQPPYQPQQPHPWVRRMYAWVLYGLIPLVPVYLWWRGRKQEEYRQHWSERFTLYSNTRIAPQSKRVWLHAVSLGETRACAPLVHAFLAQNTDAHIILTHTTPTGRAAGAQLFSEYIQSGRVTQIYAPYDLNPLLNRFFKTFAPTDVWIMETEVWPNLMAQCVARHIPATLINGRMSAKTLRQTLMWQKLMGNAYAGFTHICAQTETDAQRYRQIGVVDAQLVVTGNLKFDMHIPADQVQAGKLLKQALSTLASKPIALLASSREGEEQLLLDAIRTFKDASLWQWWIVPRHPQRFDEVAQLIDNTNLSCKRSSALAGLNTTEQATQLNIAQIVLGDTMGEMFRYYALADVVLMGGTWMPYGGQNFLEPLVLGKPTWVGQSLYNFEQIAAQALAQNVLSQAQNFSEALANIRRTMDVSTQTRVEIFLQRACGALDRLAELLWGEEQQHTHTKSEL